MVHVVLLFAGYMLCDLPFLLYTQSSLHSIFSTLSCVIFRSLPDVMLCRPDTLPTPGTRGFVSGRAAPAAGWRSVGSRGAILDLPFTSTIHTHV